MNGEEAVMRSPAYCRCFIWTIFTLAQHMYENPQNYTGRSTSIFDVFPDTKHPYKRFGYYLN